MPENDIRSPEEVLSEVLRGLQSNNSADRLKAIADLQRLTFSSAAIRAQLEKLALHDENDEVRSAAIVALGLPTSRHVRRTASRLSQAERANLLKEIDEWLKSGLLDAGQAEVIRRRYDFDA